MSDILAMQRAVWTSARSANEKLTLLAIIDYYSASSQEPWPSVATLCKRASLGRTAIIEALATPRARRHHCGSSRPRPLQPLRPLALVRRARTSPRNGPVCHANRYRADRCRKPDTSTRPRDEPVRTARGKKAAPDRAVTPKLTTGDPFRFPVT